MKTYTESKPVFSEEIPVTEPTDPAHADNINAAPKQLLQNTLVNHASIQELEKGNQMVEFEDYSGEGTDVPDPEAAISQVSSGKADKVFRQYVKASLKGLLNLAQRALSIATGKNQARVFATVEALDAWLAVPANVKQLNVGDNFYITATDVPDYWWDGKQKQKLETQKVDLTTYDQRISELYGNISSHKSSGDHDGRYYTEDEVNALLATLIITKTYTADNIEIDANTVEYFNKDVSLSGHKALGVIGYVITNADTNGTNSSNVLIYRTDVINNIVYANLKNLITDKARIKIRFTILYVKAV